MPAKPVATVCLCNLENGHPERTPQNFSAAENLENGHPERTRRGGAAEPAENLENGHPERTPKIFSAAENLENGHTKLRSVVAVAVAVAVELDNVESRLRRQQHQFFAIFIANFAEIRPEFVGISEIIQKMP